MKIFRTNQYNSLNIFNYTIITLFITLIVHFFTKYSTLTIVPYIIIFGAILLISYCSVDKKHKIDNQNNIFQKSITSLSVLFYSAIVIIISYFIFVNFFSHQTYTNPHNYSRAIKTIKHKEKISHFPKTIPPNAEKIQMYCYTSDSNGEAFILKFKINKKYIEQELKQHKFLNPDTPIGTSQDIYYIFTDNNRINIDNTTWYVLDNKENKQIYKKYFPYYSSIGVSNNMDFIIYYYIEPQD